ncbi:MAG: homoserine dehydrogenase [Cyanobacteria bacterium]|nr:homoserine dehydrogenase [Cyanobacteriota bacterium]
MRAPKPQSGTAIRTIRIGLLGLGQVGQAVARLAADRAATAQAGIRFQVEQALVRDLAKARGCPKPGRLTDNATAFLRGTYDVVIEVLDTVEPARTLVARLLGRGTAVVTANKALVAEHGAQLDSIAASRGAAFRYEATALAAVPFLGTLADRPLVASVDRVLAIVNGTSNYLLTSLAQPGITFDQALKGAQALGYAEPNAARDLDGLDAADKLVLLTSIFGWGRLSREALDVSGIRSVTADDLAAARSLGGTIKPIVSAERDASGVRAFVGPAFLAATEPLASLGGALNGIRLDGRHITNLFFSGPGAGPDVTAVTLLDDAIQAAAALHPALRPGAGPKRSAGLRLGPAPERSVFPASPATPWFLRVTCPGVLPAATAIAPLVAAAGLPVERVADYANANSRWLLIGPQGRRAVDGAIETLAATHRIDAVGFRRL